MMEALIAFLCVYGFGAIIIDIRNILIGIIFLINNARDEVKKP